MGLHNASRGNYTGTVDSWVTSLASVARKNT